MSISKLDETIDALEYYLKDTQKLVLHVHAGTIMSSLCFLKKLKQKETPMTMERINVVKVDGNDFYKGFCPACQTLQYGIKSKYCDQCGQAVKWE